MGAGVNEAHGRRPAEQAHRVLANVRICRAGHAVRRSVKVVPGHLHSGGCLSLWLQTGYRPISPLLAKCQRLRHFPNSFGCHGLKYLLDHLQQQAARLLGEYPKNGGARHRRNCGIVPTGARPTPYPAVWVGALLIMRASARPRTAGIQAARALEGQHPAGIFGRERADLVELPNLVLGERDIHRRHVVLQLAQAFGPDDD